MFNLYFKKSNLKERKENKTITLNHILTYNMVLKQHEATHHPYVTKLSTLYEIVKLYTYTC